MNHTEHSTIKPSNSNAYLESRNNSYHRSRFFN